MKLRLLLSVAATCLVVPAIALAQPPQGKDDQKDKKEQGQEKGKGGGDHKGGPQAKGGGRAEAPAPQQPQAQKPAPQAQRPTLQAQPQPQVQAQPQPQPERGGQSRRGRDRPVAQQPVSPAAQAPQPKFEGRPIPQARPEQRPGPQAGGPPSRGPVARPSGPQPSLSTWSAPAKGVTRDRSAQQWRQQNQSWDRTAIWRQQPDWYRNDRSFIGFGFTGLRLGFFFVPDRGYVSVPRQYRNRHWREGDYLPAWFRTYSVSDPWRYGLPRPPRGCEWVWLNGDVALIDRDDGYILDIARRVW